MDKSKTLDLLIESRTPVDIMASNIYNSLGLEQAVLVSYDSFGYVCMGKNKKTSKKECYFIPHGSLGNIKLPLDFDEGREKVGESYDYKGKSISYLKSTGVIIVEGNSVRLTSRENDYAALFFEKGLGNLVGRTEFYRIAPNQKRKQRAIERLKPKLEQVGLKLVNKHGKGFILTTYDDRLT